MKREPLVSIMMPVYNGYPLIKASVESLIRQNYCNWECVIVDDGSTDGTPAYIDTILDSRFVIYHLERNYGRAVARQKALELCNGKYIGMLDAEDLVHPDKFRVQVDYLEHHCDVSMISCAICSFGTKTDVLLVRGPRNDCDVVFSGNNHPIHAPSLFRAQIAKQCNYNPVLRLGEDQDFLEKYLAHNPKYHILGKVMYYYSELDSVTKSKIVENYYLYVLKYFKQKNYKMSLLFLLKFIYGKVFFPFMSINTILHRRGRKVTDSEAEDFAKYCKPIVDDYSK